MMIEYTVHTLSEYIGAFQTIPIDYQLSRRQSDDRPLLPSALRCNSDGKMLYPKSTIRSFLDEFRTNSYQYIENHSFPYEQYE